MHVGVAGVVADILGFDARPGRRGDDLARLRHHIVEADFFVLFWLCQMGVLAAGRLRQRVPGLDRHFAIGLRGQGQDHLGRIDIGLDARHALGRTLLGHLAVEALEEGDLVIGVPRDSLAAIAKLFHQRAERGEPFVEVWVVALDDRDLRHGQARHRLGLAALPILHVQRLGDLGRGVVQDRRQHHILLDPQHFGRHFREPPGDALVDLPVAARLPGRVHGRRQRVDEGMHVGRVEVVLLVPGGGRQDDVGIDAGGRHPEVDRHQQVELALRRLIVPRDLARLLAAIVAEILALDAMRGAQQMLQEIFVPFARGAEQIGAPDEQIARPVGRVVRILAGHLDVAGFQRRDQIVLRFLLGLFGGGGDLQRVGLELRRRRQPAHALGADIVVDQGAVPRTLRRRRRQDLVDGQGFVAPLVGVGVPERGGVHVPRRAAPIQPEGQRQPAGLRPQLFLPDIMRPAAAGLADAAAHHQEIDDPPVVHVHVVPVIQPGPEDHHGFAQGLLGVAGEFPRHGDDLAARHAGDGLGPGRRIGRRVVERLRHIFAAEAAVEAVIGGEQVEDGGDQRLAVLGLHALDRNPAHQHVGMIGAQEMIVLAVAEIGEADFGDVVMIVIDDQAELELVLLAAGLLLLQVPLALFAPAEADRALRHDDGAAGAVDRHGLPVGIVRFAQGVVEFGRPQQALGHIVAVALLQPHQHRHVGVLPAVALEILGLPVEVKFAQDHVAHGHGQRCVGALLGMQPDVGEFRRLGIVRADHRALGALVARLGIEMGVRRAGLRHVRAPDQQESGIVPIGAFRHVGLLAPGLRRGRRQVAIPVVERHAHAAQQRQIPRPGGVGDHRHGRDRRKADHPVRTVGLGRVGVGGGDNLRHLVPMRADEAAMAAHAGVGGALGRVLDDRFPGRHRRQGRSRLAPQLDQPRAHQWIFHPVAGIQVPAIAGAPGTAARLVVRQVGPGAGIVGLLGLPGDDPALHVDLPAARPGAVGAMGRAHHLVVLPALAIGLFPAAILPRGDAVATGEFADILAGEEVQTVEQVTHLGCPSRYAAVGVGEGVMVAEGRPRSTSCSRPPRRV